LDTPPEQLRSALAMLLGEHMELIVQAQRASFAGAAHFQAAAAQVNANTTALTKAMAAIVGPTKAAEFQAAWANHVQGLLAYTAAAAGNDQHAKTVAKQNLDGFAERLGLYVSDTVNNVLAADPLTKAITAHDQHLIDHVDAMRPRTTQGPAAGAGGLPADARGGQHPGGGDPAHGQAPAAGRRVQDRRRRHGLPRSFSQSFHQAQLNPTRPHSPDSPA
jgi:hypothetical protein